MTLFLLNFPIGRALDFVGRPYFNDLAFGAFIMASLGYIILCLVLWSYRNVVFKIPRLKLGEPFRFTLAIFLLLVASIAYPKAFGISTSRWNLIPGQWSVVYLSINTLLILSFKNIKSASSIFHLLLLLIVIKGGERVDSIVVLVLYGVLLVPKNNENILIERQLSFRIILLFIGVFVLAIAAGVLRTGAEFNIMIFIYNIIAQNTVTDVIHVYFSSFHYIQSNELSFLPFFNELFSIIPTHPWGGTHSSWNYTNILDKHISNPGGGLFYTEGVLIFGKLGVLLYSFFFGLLIRVLVKYRNRLNWLLIIFLILQMRIQWYGFLYIYTTVLLTTCFLFFYQLLSHNRLIDS